MKIYIVTCSFVCSLCGLCASGQGTFQNLDFESATVSGGSPAFVSLSDAIPGWNVSYSWANAAYPQSEVGYDEITAGGVLVTVNDINTPYPRGLIQGAYSVSLFGGGPVGIMPDGSYSATIAQTGILPAGTESITMDAWEYGAAPIVEIGGEVITMIPLESFSFYTLYGGNIPSSDVGPSVALSFTEPPAEGQSMLTLDNISFSPVGVAPEPSPLILTGIGGMLLGFWRCIRFKKR